MNTLEQPTVGLARQRNELDAETQCGGMIEIDRSDMTDALDGDAGEVEPRAESDARQDAQLMRGIYAVDVEARVGLGKALCLCVREHSGERQAFRLHPRQDIIARSVQDAVDAGQSVRRRAVAQRLDDRNAASDCCLVLERSAVRLGERGQFQPVMSKHRLVRGDERLALRQRCACQHQRRAVAAADHLDDDIDVIAGGELGRVVDPRERRGIDPSVAPAIARRHRRDPDRAVGAPLDEPGIGVEQRDDPRSDSAEAGETDPQGGRHALAFAPVLTPIDWRYRFTPRAA